MLLLLSVQIADENTVQYTYSETVTRHNGGCEVLLEWTLDCGNAHASSYQIIYKTFSLWNSLHLF